MNTLRPNAAVDPARGQVKIWTRKAHRPTRLEQCIRSDVQITIGDVDHISRNEPVTFYIVSSLSATVEREAARHNAVPVCFPAAQVWLAARIDALTAAGTDVTICTRRGPE